MHFQQDQKMEIKMSIYFLEKILSKLTKWFFLPSLLLVVGLLLNKLYLGCEHVILLLKIRKFNFSVSCGFVENQEFDSQML